MRVQGFNDRYSPAGSQRRCSVASYFAKNRKNLLLLQVVAAFLWIGYGVLLRAAPVIVANVMVASAATFTALRAGRPSEGN